MEVDEDRQVANRRTVDYSPLLSLTRQCTKQWSGVRRKDRYS